MPRRRRSKVQRLVIAIKKFIAFLLSHVGLCFIVVAYIMLGAIVFQAVEGPSELETRNNQENSRQKAVDFMWDATYDHNILEPDKWQEKVKSAIFDYKKTLEGTIRRGYDAKEAQWTFSGAFLYSLTVITTIGYGNIACRTYFGKALTIIYAILGIPLMLLFLTNIGDILAKVSKFLYRRAVKLKLLMIIWHKKRQAAKLRKASVMLSMKNKPTAAPPPFSVQTSLGYSSRRRAAKISSTSLGGQENPDTEQQQQQQQVTFRSYPKSKTTNSSQDSFLMPTSTTALAQQQQQETVTTFEEMRIEVLAHQYELEELSLRESTEEKLSKMNVPLWLVLLTMIMYLVGGAVLFCLWEKWDFLDSFYFCYISLATVGFGDLFPGASLADDKSSQEKLVITSMYLLFGMALIAMCFNLAQEEVVNKVTRIAIKLGIIKSDSYDSS